MVGKPSTDEQGNILINTETQEVLGTPYTKEELDFKNESNISFSDTISKQVSILFSEVPLNPLDINSSIKILNTMIYSHNNKMDKKITEIVQKPEQTEEDKQIINELQTSKYNFVLIPYNNTKVVTTKNDEINIEIRNVYSKLSNEEGIYEDIVNS